jgi:hypothetical protein
VGATRITVAFLAVASVTTERTVKLLPQPRPAGEHRDLAGQRELDRVELASGQVLAGPGPQPAQRRGPVHVAERGQALLARAEQFQEPAREGPLGAMKRHQIHRRDRPGLIAAVGDGFADDPFVGDELVKAGVDQLSVDLEDLGGVADQVGLGEVAVPVVGGLGERVLQPGFDPLWTVVGDPDRLGDRVGGLEADPPHL